MTFLARISLRNRSLVALASVALLVFGFVATASLKQELIPSISFPVVTVTAPYPGASPQIVERDVTEKLEEAARSTEGLNKMTSYSSAGVSTLLIEYKYGTDTDKAVSELQQAISQMQRRLPENVHPAVISGDSSDIPAMVLAVTSDVDEHVLADRLEDLVVPRFKEIDGVSQVIVTGVPEQVIRVTLDTDKLKDKKVSPEAVAAALRSAGTPIPADRVDQGRQSLAIQVGEDFSGLEDIENLRVQRIPATGVGAGPGGAPGGAAGLGALGAGGGAGIGGPGPMAAGGGAVSAPAPGGGAPGAGGIPCTVPGGGTPPGGQPGPAPTPPSPPAPPSSPPPSTPTSNPTGTPTDGPTPTPTVTPSAPPTAPPSNPPSTPPSPPRPSAPPVPSVPSGIPCGGIGGGFPGFSLPSLSFPGFPSIPAPSKPGKPVRLGDIADVELATKEASTLTRTNGKPSLGILVQADRDGNNVEISDTIRGQMKELGQRLGDGAALTVVFDQSPYIKESIEGLTTEGMLGLGFAALVILLFLLSVRSTLVTLVSIPLSLLMAMIVLWSGEFSLNILTLGGLTIAIGRVVDDSIVVIENIKRHLGYGEDKREAIITGVREVAGAITASTLTTVAVFLPIAFTGNIVGELFSSFSLTVTIALLASLAVALTVIPVLAYWFLKAPKRGGDDAAFREKALDKERRSPLQRVYVPTIDWATRHWLVTGVAAVVIFVVTMGLSANLKTNFIDDAGDNSLFISQKLPPGTSLATTDDAARKVEGVLARTRGVQSYQVTIGAQAGQQGPGFGTDSGTNTAMYNITTDPDIETEQIEAEIRRGVARLGDVGELKIGIAEQQGASSEVSVIVTARDTETLRPAADEVLRAVRSVPGLKDVSSNLNQGSRQLTVRVDQEEAAERGLTEAQIGQAVRSHTEGEKIIEAEAGGTTRDVVLTSDQPTETVADLRDLPIRTPTGSTVKLDKVADVVTEPAPAQIVRIDGEQSATISAKPEGSDLGAVSQRIQEKLDGLTLADGARARLGGASEDQAEAFASLGVALGAAIVIVYMIMVGTFRSLVQPLLLLVSIPFAMTGAVAMLLLTDTPMGVAALIGALMLVGIVVTNAIVLLDLIRQYRDQGMGIREAVIEGGRHRVRPVLMTAVATICALIPMALGLTGGGAFISQPLALVVIGGLASSTLLTLVLVPVLYTVAERVRERFARRRRRGAHAAPQQPAAGDAPA